MASEPASSSSQLWYEVSCGSHLPPVETPWQWAPILDMQHWSLWLDLVIVGAGLSHSMLLGCLCTTVLPGCTLSLHGLELRHNCKIWGQGFFCLLDILTVKEWRKTACMCPISPNPYFTRRKWCVWFNQEDSKRLLFSFELNKSSLSSLSQYDIMQQGWLHISPMCVFIHVVLEPSIKNVGSTKGSVTHVGIKQPGCCKSKDKKHQCERPKPSFLEK